MLEKLANAFKVTDGLNGLKLILGAAIVVLGHQIGAVNDLIPIYPQAADTLQHASNALGTVTHFVEQAANIVGNALLGLGAIHKVVKIAK